MANPEVKTMNECTSVLVTGLEAVDVEEVADALKDQSLLAGDVYDGLSLPTKTKKQKARDIVKGVSSKVKANPKNFMKFLGVLRSQEGLEDLVNTLEKKHIEKGGQLAPTKDEQAQPEASGGARGSAQPSSDVFKLLQHVGIDSNQLDVPPESSQLYDIAKRQGPEWEHCAVKLGLEDQQISDIKENNRHDVEKQRQKALAAWKQQSSFMGTYRRLVEVFLEVKRNDLAEYVCNLVARSGMQRDDDLATPEVTAPSFLVTHTAARGALGGGDLSKVHVAIFDAKTKWYQIGMLLNVDVNTLDSIDDEEKDNSNKLLTMLKHWLQAGTNQSWEALDKALRNKTVARPDVADKLSSK